MSKESEEKYEIECYIESIISKDSSINITVKGDNGYLIERDSGKSARYNCFWSMTNPTDCNTAIKLYQQAKPIEIDEKKYKIVELSYIHRKKVKLIVTWAQKIKVISIETV